MEIKYTPEGEEGKQCKDCEHFKPTEGNKGNCFGHEVAAEGGCNFFKNK